MLDEQYKHGEYLQKVPDWHAGDSPWKARKVLRILKQNNIQARSIADVGCGAGEILARLQQQLPDGTHFVGYDISPQAIAICENKSNDALQFRNVDFLNADTQTFDVVLVLDVFEHVSNYLDFIYRLRARSEYFVFHIPLDINVEAVFRQSRPIMEMRTTYGHLHYFTTETALATLKDAGYTIEDCIFTWDREISGVLWMPPGLWRKCKHLVRMVLYAIEKTAFRWRPATLARFRKGYNLLVLAKSS
ncbi:MAG: methyltransferase domain-containing protein [Hyphomicrobiales bacterium]|nr:methyltransferase domain-containing protein [Hyphomicrobiales bacterium]